MLSIPSFKESFSYAIKRNITEAIYYYLCGLTSLQRGGRKHVFCLMQLCFKSEMRVLFTGYSGCCAALTLVEVLLLQLKQ